MHRSIAAMLLALVGPVALHAMEQSKKPALLVDLQFVPQESVATESGSVALPPSLIDRSVDIRVEDSRNLPDAQALGEGTDDNDRYFPIRATADVVQFVAGAVTRIADSQALKKGTPPDRKLELRLTRFAVNESNKAVGSTYAAEVHVAFTLKNGDGRTLAEGASSGVANRYGRKRSAANCSEVLSDALKAAFLETLADEELQSGWMSGQPSSVADSTGGESPGGGATVEERLKKLEELLEKGLITEAEHKAARAEILKDL